MSLPLLSRPAAVTDQLAQAPSSIYRRRESYTVCETPDCPEYVFGNYIVLHEPPGENEIDQWREVWSTEFPRERGIKIAVLQWETPTSVKLPAIQVDTLTVYHGWRGTRMPKDLSMESVKNQQQWSELVEFASRETGSGFRFTNWRYQEYKILVERGQCIWLVARDESRIVCSGGLVYGEDVARYQEVITSASHRRRGLATELCRNLASSCPSTRPQFVALAELGSAACGVYENLGMTVVGYQHNLLLEGWTK